MSRALAPWALTWSRNFTGPGRAPSCPGDSKVVVNSKNFILSLSWRPGAPRGSAQPRAPAGSATSDMLWQGLLTAPSPSTVPRPAPLRQDLPPSDKGTRYDRMIALS